MSVLNAEQQSEARTFLSKVNSCGDFAHHYGTLTCSVNEVDRISPNDPGSRQISAIVTELKRRWGSQCVSDAGAINSIAKSVSDEGRAGTLAAAEAGQSQSPVKLISMFCGRAVQHEMKQYPALAATQTQ